MLLRVHPDNPGERHLKIITDCLHSGGLVIYPSDTIYGLGCDITQIKAVDKIAQIKGIKREKANFSFICHNMSHLSDFTKPLPNHIFRLMRKALPGPFTFILNASSNVPHYFQSKKKTVGIRIPNHLVPLQIVEKLGNPIMTTSIHDEDEIIEYSTDPELIYEKFKDLVDIVIDSGHGGNIASTVVDCTGDEPVIIREGKGNLLEFL
ncbi:MAG: L-threonylcarbamoyladenylate synthase [Bacteroidetes bacterium]|nr:L-threonylcarbamoyladenylate synthase [Bacteroidota bacterium]